MRFLIAVAAVVLVASPAAAADISLKLADGTQSSIVQLPTVFDQCIAGLTIRGDASVCKIIANFLVSMSNELRSAQGDAAKAAADKLAADKAAAATPPADPVPSSVPSAN